MAKRILIPLEEYDYSKVAIEYGVHLISATDCQLDSLFVVDIPAIEKSIGPVPAGGTYYALKEEKMRAEQEKQEAERLMAEFNGLCKEKNILHNMMIREGDPEHIIIEESKYYDLVIVGCKTSFQYGKERDKKIQQQLVSHGIRPVLIIPPEFRDMKKVLFCFDGSVHSIKSIHQFVQLGFWKDRNITLITVGKDEDDAKQLQERMGNYLEAWKIPYEKKWISGNAREKIPEFIETAGVDLAVLGARGKSGLKSYIFGSTTDALIKNNDIPLFIFH